VLQMQGTSSDIELAVGTLQWDVLFTAALCLPSRGLAPSPKWSLREGGPKATEGMDFFEKPLRIWDPHSRRSHGAWSRCNEITNDAATSCVRASDQECRDQALSPTTDRPTTPGAERSGGLRSTPTIPRAFLSALVCVGRP
jgi:hypothetical protein